nr:DUF3515 family protein [Austwickia sp. TVS 96-490-7B]
MPGGPEVRPARRGDSAACAAVGRHWPASVGGMERIDLPDDPAGAVGWGDPTIIARCGMDSPSPTTDECIDANGIGWVARPLPDGMAFVSYGRDPAIEVLVPRQYSPEPLILGAFADAARALPDTGHHCR